MEEHWRLILQKDTSAAYGLAVDETTALSVARNDSPPILHLYNFLPCVVLGRYQSIEEAINVEACRAQGLEINRRHTGGGTVLMGPKQLALGFSIPKDYPGVGPSINHIFTNLGGVLCKALGNLGLKAKFRPKNDIEIKGKKIAGLSASLEERDVAFFHTSLLLDFNFNIMMKVFKLPIKKLSDKHISCFTQRMTTIKTERHKRLDLPSFQSLVRKSFEEHFGVTFRIDTLNQWELDQLDLLLRQRYTNPDWIYTKRHPRVGTGFASAKTPGGMVELGVTLAGGVIEAAYLTGDFLATSAEINEIESALRYCPASKTEINKRLKKVMGTGTIHKVNRSTIADLAVKAAREAKSAREEALRAVEEARKAEEKKKEREAEAMRKAMEVRLAEREAAGEITTEEAQAITEGEPPAKPKQTAKKKAEKKPAGKKAAAKKSEPAGRKKAAAGKTKEKAGKKKAAPAKKKAAVKPKTGKKPARKKAKPSGKKAAGKKAAKKPKTVKAKKAKTATKKTAKKKPPAKKVKPKPTKKKAVRKPAAKPKKRSGSKRKSGKK